jgi:hypothetical protein
MWYKIAEEHVAIVMNSSNENVETYLIPLFSNVRQLFYPELK